jgi:hypothetical protein
MLTLAKLPSPAQDLLWQHLQGFALLQAVPQAVHIRTSPVLM